MSNRNPMQPVIKVDGVVRFKENKIVRTLLDHSSLKGFSLNELYCLNFSQDDWEQFYQLIGYSLSGYHELSKVSDESAMKATDRAKEIFPDTGGGCRDHGCKIHLGVEKVSKEE